MKNIFRFLMTVAVLFTASCAKEDISSSIGSGEVEVTFTANLQDLGSRAYGNAEEITTLRYYVFDKDGNPLAGLNTDNTITAAAGTKFFSVPLVLIKGMTYKILFWADNGGDFYTINPEKGTVTANYNNALANDESRDAFYGVIPAFDPATAKSEDAKVVLKRPFAQLNAITKDFAELAKSGVQLTKSQIVGVIPTTLNVFDGTLGDATQEVTFAFDVIPTDEDTKDELTPLSMNYILAPATQKFIADITFSYEGTIDFPSATYTNIPLQRNYKTNIIGKLLTKTTDFEVEIKPGFDTPDQEPNALVKAAINGGEFTLTENIVLESPLNILADLTINLNGKTISAAVAKGDGAVIEIAEGVKAVISGGTVESTNENGDAAINNAGELVLQNVTIKGAPLADGGYSAYAVISSGNLIIEQGTAVSADRGCLKFSGDGETVINGGHFTNNDIGTRNLTSHVVDVEDGGTHKLTINGGTFKHLHSATSGGVVICNRTRGTVYVNGGNYSGGNYNGYNNLSDYGYGGTFAVTGGIYTSKPADKYIVTGYKTITADNLYYVLPEVIADAAVAANVTAVTESTADVATALATNNGEATMFMWNDVAYIAKYGKVIITSAADEATTVRGVVENAASLTSATVAEGVEVVGNRTFRKCANLETVALPNTLTEIGPAVFQSCSKLANVTIPASVTTIGEGAFKECTSLTSINIPDGVTRIESECLRASGLEEVEFHAGVTYFGAQAFRDCKQLKKVIINAPEFTIEANAFGVMSGALPGTVIYVANAEMKAYLESTLAYKNQFTIVVHNSVSTADELKAALAEGGMVTLQNDITLTPTEALTLPAGVILNGNGKQINGTIYAGGDVTFVGHTKVTAFSASYYNRTITIGEGACLEVTGDGRVSLAYGNTFDITGNVADAKTADKSTIQPSLIIPGGISITGGNDAVFNIKNAYVQIGSTSSKNSAANGTFTINIENSIAEFTNQLTFAEPTNGNNPTFNLNVKNSVLTTGTKLCIAAPNCNMEVDNSTVTLGSYLRNSGTLKLKNDSVLTGATIQFGENGGNNGAITVDNSRFTITGTSTGNPYDGRGTGSITAKNDATVTVDYYKDMTITVDTTSTFTGNKVQ